MAARKKIVHLHSSYSSGEASTQVRSLTNSGWLTECGDAWKTDLSAVRLAQQFEDTSVSQRAMNKLIAHKLLQLEEREAEIMKAQAETQRLAAAILKQLSKSSVSETL